MGAEDLAREWIAAYTPSSPLTKSEREEAQDAVADLVADDPAEGVSFVRAVLSTTEDPWVLENTAAGPIEDLLRNLPREMLMVLATHRSTRAVKEAVSCLWTGQLSEPVREELKRILDDLRQQDGSIEDDIT